MWRCVSNHSGRAPKAKSASAASATGDSRGRRRPSSASRDRESRRTSGIFAQPVVLAERDVRAVRVHRHREALDGGDAAGQPCRVALDVAPRAVGAARGARSTVARTMGRRTASGHGTSCSRAARVAAASTGSSSNAGSRATCDERRVVRVDAHVRAAEPRHDAIARPAGAGARRDRAGSWPRRRARACSGRPSGGSPPGSSPFGRIDEQPEALREARRRRPRAPSGSPRRARATPGRPSRCAYGSPPPRRAEVLLAHRHRDAVVAILLRVADDAQRRRSPPATAVHGRRRHGRRGRAGREQQRRSQPVAGSHPCPTCSCSSPHRASCQPTQYAPSRPVLPSSRWARAPSRGR